jgi:hypothetical protein
MNIIQEKFALIKHYQPPFSHGKWGWNGVPPMTTQEFLFKMLMELD